MNTPQASAAFDKDELKFLALKAMRTDRDEDALRLLKQALALSPRDAELQYLLAMAHSNLGMVDRAVEELEQVLSVAPNLVNGRFQLGLLLFTRRDFKRSESVWAPLIASLPADSPLRVFATGLTQVGHDQLEAAIVTLEHGISICDNESLNADMSRIVTEAKRYLAQTGKGAKAPSTVGTTGHVLLSGYTTHGSSQ